MATPTDEPSFTGLRTYGRWTGSSWNRLSLSTTLPAGIRMPCGTSTILVSSLSIAITEVSRPLWVYLTPIRSIRPWTLPSSPGVPWRALKTTSGCASRRRWATSRPMSIRVTRWPRHSSASATPPPLISDTSRSADQPPISTATCSLFTLIHPYRLLIGVVGRHAHALNFPFELYPGMRAHPAPDFLAQRLDVRSARLAQVEQEVAMLFRDLG